MASPTTRLFLLAALLGSTACLAHAASAQETDTQETPAHARARAATSSLNGGPADTTLTPRANAAPPLSAVERTTPVVPVTPRQVSPRPVAPGPVAPRSAAPATATRQTPAQSQSARTQPAQAQSAQTRPARPVRPGQAPAAPVMDEPTPIKLPLGYYVRGDKDCNAVWPGEGDLAWLTPTAFTIDFGGCEPGQFLQTGPGAWRETQQCHTELGNDAGGYEVTYQLVADGTLLRHAQLAIDGSSEEDTWHACEVADVPASARFKG